jgi:CheY-like chemotaxis protein
MATILHDLNGEHNVGGVMLKQGKILIVEDDAGIRDALKLMLEYSGYHVETAENGKAGIERLSEIETPCLILLDLMMPVMNGWEFADTMRKNVSHANIPIVVATAFSDKAQSFQNPSGIIKKPIDMDTLLRFVETHCH